MLHSVVQHVTFTDIVQRAFLFGLLPLYSVLFVLFFCFFFFVVVVVVAVVLFLITLLSLRKIIGFI